MAARDTLIAVEGLAEAILTTHAESLGATAAASGAVRGGGVEATELTSTGVAVVRIAPSGNWPGAVIKIAMTPPAGLALERENEALLALRREDRLGSWLELLPRAIAQGRIDGRPYRVDRALPGHPALDQLSNATMRRRVLNTAAGAIDALHRRTATIVRGNVAEAWVDAHIRELTRPMRRRLLTSQLELLRDELHDALAGQAFSTGWIHGDYWLGNVLWGEPGPDAAAPAGIIDWEASAANELPMHDFFHLVLYTRRLLTGRELGHIVRDLLIGDEWSGDERRFLDRFGGWHRCGSLSERHLLLLYWLRHVAMHARQQSPPVGLRYRVWEQRNVLPVLASL
ncbi:MAG: aminoglycoside phosphotransferase family protein [Solirubrobacterales bacterium]|nr:aminoglycoside phosphotransferase family protein [Solirubrobacterales bacterium]